MTIDYDDLDFHSIKKTVIGDGLELLKEEKLRDAILLLEKGTKQFPESYEAYEYLGITYLNSGLSNRAIGALKKAVEIKPDSATANYNLAIAFENAGVIEDALAHYSSAVELNPAHALAQEKVIELAQIIPEKKRARIRLLKK